MPGEGGAGDDDDDDDVVMLVGSATTNRWKRGGAKGKIRETVGSFRCALAPASGIKARAKGSG